MKFAAIVAAAAYATVANAASCDVASLQTLLTSSDTTTCASDSGYAVTSLATPTDAEMAVMCTSTACQSVLSQLEGLAPSECTVGTFSLYADLITPVTEYCSGTSTSSASVGSSVASSASASAASASATSAGSEPIAASSASLDSTEEVTVAPTNTTSSASSDSDVAVGDSDSGSNFTIETQAPASDSASASTTTDTTSSASSAAADPSSGSSAGVAVSPSTALLGSALVATAALFL